MNVSDLGVRVQPVPDRVGVRVLREESQEGARRAGDSGRRWRRFWVGNSEYGVQVSKPGARGQGETVTSWGPPSRV